MTRLQKALAIRLAMLITLVLTGCIPSIRVDLTGGWSGQLLWTDGPSAGFVSPFFLDLILADRELSGSVRLTGPASQSFDLPIVEGRARNFSLDLAANGTNPLITPPVTVSFAIDGDYTETSMSGTGSQIVNGSTYAFTWEAVRISGPPAEPTDF